MSGYTGGGRFLAAFPGGFGTAAAAVHLPNGARLSFMEVQGCDSSATGELWVTLFSELPTPGGEDIIQHGFVATPAAGAPGCNYFGANLTPDTVDNYNRTYYIHFNSNVASTAVRFTSVRVFYHLQVSPAPGGATFADVPVGHPFHRFVEALATSGITGGCGGGNYCPDAPLTRGQMAVFLAAALGLHWPN